MKKLISILLVTVMLLSMAVVMATPASAAVISGIDKKIYKIETAPTVDGKIDNNEYGTYGLLSDSGSNKTEWTNGKGDTNVTANNAKLYAAWTDDVVYFAATYSVSGWKYTTGNLATNSASAGDPGLNGNTYNMDGGWFGANYTTKENDNGTWGMVQAKSNSLTDQYYVGFSEGCLTYANGVATVEFAIYRNHIENDQFRMVCAFWSSSGDDAQMRAVFGADGTANSKSPASGNYTMSTVWSSLPKFTLVDEVKVIGFQQNTTEATKVRFALGVMESAIAKYSSVGVVVTQKNDETKTLNLYGSTVYTSILAADEQLNATDFGYNYIMGFVVSNMKEGETYTIAAYGVPSGGGSNVDLGTIEVTIPAASGS